jgi:hypothetical protein
MDMGGMGADAGMGGDMPPATDDLGNGGGGDAFGAVDAAAGGDDELGRERRDIGEAAKEKGDGNLANNAKPYDKVTRGDVIAGRLGKDEKGGKKKPASAKAK